MIKTKIDIIEIKNIKKIKLSKYGLFTSYGINIYLLIIAEENTPKNKYRFET